MLKSGARLLLSAKLFHGFTLIETVIAISVFSVIGLGFTEFFRHSAAMYIKTASEEELYQETWMALERIRMELGQAVDLPGQTTGPVTVPAGGQAGSTLTFTRPSASADKCPACADHSTTVTFTLTPADGKLWRTTSSAPMKLLADNISSFAVTASGGPVEQRYYQITITRVSDPSDNEGSSVTMTTIVYPSGAKGGAWAQLVQ
ncbi:hypothetical protein MNBD_NITROSPINAE04-1023 [hydrothermal vent metagenome]|uniref:Prepilin-type N-terminal cleavage/methylation domain-containing protein n=1 Tax=hydrothermal vent metagenome TaxID=652676 RepID=A0A3B1BVV7_9ZZZZ